MGGACVEAQLRGEGEVGGEVAARPLGGRCSFPPGIVYEGLSFSLGREAFIPVHPQAS